GLAFGTLYDFSTVIILTLAGLSFAMTLSSWIPPYLHRLGMEFNWSVRLGVLVYLFTGVKFAVTVYYGADLDAHRAAYLTSGVAVYRVPVRGVRVRRQADPLPVGEAQELRLLTPRAGPAGRGHAPAQGDRGAGRASDRGDAPDRVREGGAGRPERLRPAAAGA